VAARNVHPRLVSRCGLVKATRNTFGDESILDAGYNEDWDVNLADPRTGIEPLIFPAK
jgi:hypothetical protein